MLSLLECLPDEVIEKIALCLVLFSFLGPPADLPALLLLSRTIWKKIARKKNPHLYAQIFLLKFDISAPVRRLGDDCEHATELSDELVKRFRALKRLRKNLYPRLTSPNSHASEFLRVDLWIAYLMFIESDGNNARQLIEYAKIDRLALDFIKDGGRLHDCTRINGGWTVDNEVNALATWLFWFTDKERVRLETPAERQLILQAYVHLFLGSFKYTSTHAPITSFFIPPNAPPPPAPVHSLAASPITPPCIIPDHFGYEISLARPLITPAALLSCVVRFEVASAETALPLSLRIPATRVEAIAVGWQGPTLEDHYVQHQVRTKLMEWGGDDTAGGMGSERHEHDWMRFRTCYNPWSHPAQRDRVFTPGMLDGEWVGKWFGIPVDEFTSLVTATQAGQPASTRRPPIVYSVPMQFRLKEHHQYDRNATIDFDDVTCDGTGKGVLNAWFPDGTTIAETTQGLRVHVPNMIDPSIYRTYDGSAAALAALDQELGTEREHLGSYGGGVWDIILTAKTDDAFGDVWGHKRYHGRVRDWDGLVVLAREANEGEGVWIFRGYVHGKQNLIGRWRETGTSVDRPGFEGAWSMTKREG